MATTILIELICTLLCQKLITETFVHWEAAEASLEKLTSQVAYWKEQLKFSPLKLPVDFHQSSDQDFRGECLYFSISKKQTGKLDDYLDNIQ